MVTGAELRGVDKLKTLFPCCFAQTAIQGVKAMVSRVVVRPAERGSKLEGIRGAKRMPQQDALGVFPHLLRGVDLTPTLAQSAQSLASLIGTLPREGPITFAASDSRETFDRGAPPDEKARNASHLGDGRRGWLGNQQRHDR